MRVVAHRSPLRPASVAVAVVLVAALSSPLSPSVTTVAAADGGVTNFVVMYKTSQIQTTWPGGVFSVSAPPSPLSDARLQLLTRAADNVNRYLTPVTWVRTLGIGAYEIAMGGSVADTSVAYMSDVLTHADPDIAWVAPNLTRSWEIESVTSTNDKLWGDSWHLKGPPEAPGGLRADAAWDDEWRLLADESEQAYVAGAEPRLTRYGAHFKGWNFAQTKADVRCSPDDFGGDPAVSTRKRCEVSERYKTVASDSQSFEVSTQDSVVARYGWGNYWAYKRFKPIGTATKVRIDCSSNTFGDPYFGWHKVCQIDDRGDGAGVVALDGERFTLRQRTPAYGIRRGSLDKWTYRRVPPGDYTCDNPTFGNPEMASPICEVLPTMGAGVRVAVLDTGVSSNPDIANNLLPGATFANGSYYAGSTPSLSSDCPGEPPGVLQHGTRMASAIVAEANNAKAAAGVAPLAQVVPIKVMKCGRTVVKDADMANAITWAAGLPVPGMPYNQNPARVINLSLGAAPGPCGRVIQTAIDRAHEAGSVVVAAVGNDGRNISGQQMAPVTCDHVVAVAGGTKDGSRNQDPQNPSDYGDPVDLMAPGDGVWTLQAQPLAPSGYEGVTSFGASIGAALVSGVAALMLGVNPRLSADNVEARLALSARSFPTGCTGCGAGLADAARAVRSARAITTKVVDDGVNVVTAPADIAASFTGAPDKDEYQVMLPPGRTLTATFDPARPGNKWWSMAWSYTVGSLPATGNKKMTHTNTTTKTETVLISLESLAVDSDYGYTLRVTW